MKQQQHGRQSMSAADVQSSNLTSARFFGGVQKSWMTDPHQPVSRPGPRHLETQSSGERGHRASNRKLQDKSQSLSLDLAAAKSTEASPSPGKLLTPAAELSTFPVDHHSTPPTIDKLGDPAFSIPSSARPDTARSSRRTRSPIRDRRQLSSKLVSSLPSPSPSLEHHEPSEAAVSPDGAILTVQESHSHITNDQSHCRKPLERSDASPDQTGILRVDP